MFGLNKIMIAFSEMRSANKSADYEKLPDCPNRESNPRPLSQRTKYLTTELLRHCKDSQKFRTVRNSEISDCPDRVSIVQWSDHWYVKPEAMDSILCWGSQISFS